MTLLDNLLQRFYAGQQPLAPSRNSAPRPIYTIGIEDAVERFKAYHANFAPPEISPESTDQYVTSLLEQMVAHFEPNQSNAVQSFVGHYIKMITENVSPNYMYHPLRYLKQLDTEGYRHYMYCLYGFAEDIYTLFVQHGLFSPQGELMASFETYQLGTLYLIVRPELPSHELFV